MGLLWSILGQASERSQEVAISDLTLDDIRWVNTVEDKGLAALVSEVVGGATPVEPLLFNVVPVLVALVLDAIDEQSLRTVREGRVVPREASLDDVLVGQLPQPGLGVRERCSVRFVFLGLCFLVGKQWLAILLLLFFLIRVFFDHFRSLPLLDLNDGALVRGALFEDESKLVSISKSKKR